jgi:hypothetical protein
VLGPFLQGVLVVEGERAWQLLRAERHRILNQVQIALGWLQLGDHARAERALLSIQEALCQERKRLQGLDADSILRLLELEAAAERHGVALTWERAEPVGAVTEANLAAVLGRLSGAPVHAMRVRLGPAGLEILEARTADDGA